MDSIKFTHQFLLQMTTGVNTAAFAQASDSGTDVIFICNNCDTQQWTKLGLTLRQENGVRGVQEQVPEEYIFELGYNVTKGWFCVSLKTSVITEENDALVNCEELTGTTEYLTLYMGSRINRRRYNRIRLCISKR
jgi:hypothetical protein